MTTWAWLGRIALSVGARSARLPRVECPLHAATELRFPYPNRPNRNAMVLSLMPRQPGTVRWGDGPL